MRTILYLLPSMFFFFKINSKLDRAIKHDYKINLK